MNEAFSAILYRITVPPLVFSPSFFIAEHKAYGITFAYPLASKLSIFAMLVLYNKIIWANNISLITFPTHDNFTPPTTL